MSFIGIVRIQICGLVFGDQILDRLLDLPHLSQQFRLGTAPLFRAVGRYLAAVDGEALAQPQGVLDVPGPGVGGMLEADGAVAEGQIDGVAGGLPVAMARRRRA